jgi:(p)ppGpp synthase/HD superfamily hydrolase
LVVFLDIKQKQLKMIDTHLIETAKNYAIKCHAEVNQKYDGMPYSVHLHMAYDYALKYIYLVPVHLRTFVLAAAWIHDVIEDARQTYNDVKKVLGLQVAEIAYALTNEKGRTRKERANAKYYQGIRDVEGAIYDKICDRLANVSFSITSKSSMLDAYKREYPDFKEELYREDYKPMFDELEQMLEIKTTE